VGKKGGVGKIETPQKTAYAHPKNPRFGNPGLGKMVELRGKIEKTGK